MGGVPGDLGDAQADEVAEPVSRAFDGGATQKTNTPLVV
jgi:hypothetical protein